MCVNACFSNNGYILETLVLTNFNISCETGEPSLCFLRILSSCFDEQ